ncbi:hypothetical protein ALC60_12620 [Trachymyrmex zeteki]|uniref:Uncharacterized protein n=1 Tax=Mycetomoellerius zeteki TaxID=64791 RepID=A0A151WK97_9HYME|nr:hypothetical protein ALC60_12620 [Trachymyrmex zeteki]
MHDQDTLPLVRNTSQVWVLLRTIPTGFSVTSIVWFGTLPLSKRVTKNELGAIIPQAVVIRAANQKLSSEQPTGCPSMQQAETSTHSLKRGWTVGKYRRNRYTGRRGWDEWEDVRNVLGGCCFSSSWDVKHPRQNFPLSVTKSHTPSDGLPHSWAGRLRVLAALTAGRPPATQLQVDSPDRPVARIRRYAAAP